MTQSIDLPWVRIVLQADPEFYRDRIREPEYEFTKRTFRANRSERWPFNYVAPEEEFEPSLDFSEADNSQYLGAF